jgi:hypothetical protein
MEGKNSQAPRQLERTCLRKGCSLSENILGKGLAGKEVRGSKYVREKCGQIIVVVAMLPSDTNNLLKPTSQAACVCRYLPS